MPLPVDKLNEDSSPPAVRSAIKRSFPICIHEMKAKGHSQEEAENQCGGRIYGTVKEKTGRDYGRGS